MLNDTPVDFSNLTVFSGANGAGKSTIIQALLLFRQTFYSGYNIERERECVCVCVFLCSKLHILRNFASISRK